VHKRDPYSSQFFLSLSAIHWSKIVRCMLILSRGNIHRPSTWASIPSPLYRRTLSQLPRQFQSYSCSEEVSISQTIRIPQDDARPLLQPAAPRAGLFGQALRQYGHRRVCSTDSLDPPRINRQFLQTISRASAVSENDWVMKTGEVARGV
jgi:hypothetical protein